MLPSLSIEKAHSTVLPKKISNPMFGEQRSATIRSPMATAMGGIPSEMKSRLPSPKVHPAPQPPVWPHSAASSTRVKKLSWGDDKVCGEEYSFLNVKLVFFLSD